VTFRISQASLPLAPPTVFSLPAFLPRIVHMPSLLALLSVLAPALGLRLPMGITPVARCGAPSMGLIPENSLAGKMFGTLSETFKGVTDLLPGEDEAAPPPPPAGARGEQLVADVDARAQTGELTFKDFLTMSQAFAKLDGKMPGLPGDLSAKQIAETREKFAQHEKIVEVMMEDELNDPQLLMEDLKAGGARPGPRIQRLAEGSGLAETDVGLFLMQFEAMRESTRRIADGEDPDEVTESMAAAPPGANRQARRAAAKKAAKKAKR